MNSNLRPRFCGVPFILKALAPCISLLPLLSLGQGAPPAEPLPAPFDDEVIELSPFEVRAELDTGYISQNSASGSRLSSALKDTPAAITVFTSEFLQDIGAVTVEDLAKYAPNVEADVGFVSGSPNGNSLMNPTSGLTVRGLPTSGGPASGRTVNFFSYIFEIDTYNTDRIEFSRGPNSILFGMGQAGGSFNIQSRTADVRRSKYSTTVRGGSFNTLRAAVDINQPLIDGKLALRLDAVTSHKTGWRPWEFSNDKRLYLALRYQLTPKTTLDVQSETAELDFRRPRPYLGPDHISAWLAAGRPTSAVKFTSSTPDSRGLRRISSSAWWVYVDGDPATTLRNFVGMGRTANPLNNTDLTPMLQDFSLVPQRAVLTGAGTGNSARFSNNSAFLRHEFSNDLFAELAVTRQRYDSASVDINGPDMALFYDPNQNLFNLPAGSPTSIPNPNVGRPYVEAFFIKRQSTDRRDDVRLTTAYNLDLGKWFGRHQIAGLGERWEQKSRTTSFAESRIDTPSAPGAPEDATNLVRRRTYVDLAGPVAQIAMADPATTPLPGVGWVTRATPSYNRYYLNSWMLATQSKFWNGRIVGTAGYRHDYLYSKLSSASRSTARVGGYTAGFLEPYGPTSSNHLDGVTRNQGIVFHATDWVSLFANRSTNFSIPALNQRTLPRDPVPPPNGETKDLGAQFNLFSGKIITRITYYQTAVQDNSASAGTGNIQDRINNIWNAFATEGRITPAQRDQELVLVNAYNFDNASQGWEGEVVANVTSNWRFMLNASNNKTTWTNVGRAIREYIEAHRPEFVAPFGTPTSVNQTALAELALVDTYVDQNFNQLEGGLLLLSPKWNVNLRTNYSFRQDLLKGISVGLGGRWRSGTMLGYTTTNPATRQPIWSGSNTLLDANIGYRRKMKWFQRTVDWSIQLNVNNALNNDRLLPQTANVAGDTLNYRFQTPREWILSTTATF